MPLYLGLDCSTQSLTAIVIDGDPARPDAWQRVFESSLNFDEALPAFGTRHGVLPHADPRVAQAPPAMWRAALDAMMARIAASGLDLSQLDAIAGAAQQHGSVYLTAGGDFARAVAPIWMDASTAAECAEIESAVGGAARLAQHTGSRAFERFTAAQIRKFWKDDPAGYEATDRIHLVSSYMASLLIGANAPLDPGDASGMNLMDLRTSQWWTPAVEACAPDLARRLPAIVPPSTVIGTLAPHWQMRHGLPPARVLVWTGDNPSSLIGAGLIDEGQIGISLGTSDTIFGPMREPRVSTSGDGHVFASPTGAFMALTCFANGSLARENVRDMFGLDWAGFSDLLRSTPPGNNGRMLLPWFEPEITPHIATPRIVRHQLDAHDAAGHVRAVIEAQMLALALHSRWMGVTPRAIRATGGASVNDEVLQVMADVFGAPVTRAPEANTAALGAAIRAMRGRVQEEAAAVFAPAAAGHAVYLDMLPRYAALERANR